MSQFAEHRAAFLARVARDLETSVGSVSGANRYNLMYVPGNAKVVLKAELIQVLRREFALDWGGIHGAAHWARVRFNGLRIAGENGARSDVVECFALLHDSQRIHDGTDKSHGARAADYARQINRQLLHLDAAGLDQLVYACEYHSDGLTEADTTVQTCWDADRLDLGRVGIKPSPSRLCTITARDPDFLNAAYHRSLRHTPYATGAPSMAPTVDPLVRS